MDADERSQYERGLLPHLDAAFNLAYWLTQDEHGAEDVVQEAFARAAQYFSSFRGGDGRAWLLGVVRRAALDWLAKRKSLRSVAFDEKTHESGDDSADPQQLAVRKMERAQVRRALEDLPPALREIVVLRELEGLSYQQIASIAEIPIGTVMSRLSRGRQQLERLLASCSEGGST